MNPKDDTPNTRGQKKKLYKEERGNLSPPLPFHLRGQGILGCTKIKECKRGDGTQKRGKKVHKGGGIVNLKVIPVQSWTIRSYLGRTAFKKKTEGGQKNRKRMKVLSKGGVREPQLKQSEKGPEDPSTRGEPSRKRKKRAIGGRYARRFGRV